jgi:hypothetical protein
VAIAVVAAAAAAFYYYRQADAEVRRQFEAFVAQHYACAGLKVTVRSAQLIDGKGIRVHDLLIAEPGAAGPRAELLYVEEAMLECSTDWKDLINGALDVRRVTVRRPTLRATRRPDGTWSSAKLLPPPHFGERPPEVDIQGGIIEIFDPLRASPTTLTLRDVNLALIPVPMTEPGATPELRRLKGMLAGDAFRGVEFEGLLDLQAPSFTIRGHVDTLEISPELRDSLPDPIGSQVAALGALGNLHGQGSVQFEMSYDQTAAVPLKFDVSGRLAGGRISDSRLPHAFTDIAATIHVNNTGVAISDLTARSGQATLRIPSFQWLGFGSNSPMTLAAEVRQLDLDRSLFDILPQPLQEQWNKYRPAGEIDADLRLAYDGQTWRPEVTVQCLNVAFEHFQFPYRLDQGKGTLELKNDLLELNLTAYTGSQPVRLEAVIANPLHGPIGWFEAWGDNIQLDERLLRALPPKPQTVVRSLNPSGEIGFWVRLAREKPDEPMHEHLRLRVNRCSMCYDKFPYPLAAIRGDLELRDGSWTFSNLEGSNDTARVSCNGGLSSGPAGNELVLNLKGRDVPLVKDLRNALNERMQHAWDDLQPRGTIDLTAVKVQYWPEQKKFSVEVHAVPQRESTSIEPVQFPFRMDRLQGEVIYRDGKVTFEGFKAEHGQVKVAATGGCDLLADGRWHMHFGDLWADRLHADRDLINALPERLKKVVTELNPTGTVNLRGILDLEGSGRPGEPMQSQWNVRLDSTQASLRCGGLPLENLHGEVTLQGGFDGKDLRSRGELRLDSLTYRDGQLSQILGPIWIENDRVLFGSWVDRPDGRTQPTEATGPHQTPRALTTVFCGGKLIGDGWVLLGAEPRYAVNATLTNADLSQFTQDLPIGGQKLRGKILATADLTGSGHTRNSLSGRGTIRLTDGDVYELPVMIALLKILSIRPPDQNAFSDATIDYRIEGEHIYFEPIVFHGDAITLRGKGQLDFQSQIDLTFYAMVGRGELDVPVIKQIFRTASQQLMLIHVTGTLQKPETIKEVLPAVNQALQQLQGDSQNRK